VLDSQLRLPVLLQRVDADLAVGGHVRVEYLGDEVGLGRLRGEALAEDELEAEDAAKVGRVRYNNNNIIKNSREVGEFRAASSYPVRR